MAKSVEMVIAEQLLPSLRKWDTFGGGIGAGDRHSYSRRVPEGKYYIDPVQSRTGRHLGYGLRFTANERKTPKGSHSGLWHDLGIHLSAAGAVLAAREHYAKGFE